jgi:hypothetical protein
VDNQKQNFAAQLRGLRLLLGQDNKPISGEAFSEKSGVALGTVRAVESGSRKLNAEDRRKIKRRLCAQWNDRKQRWVDARNERIPYSRQIYDEYAKAISDAGVARELPGVMAVKALFYLLEKLPPDKYALALFDTYDSLNRIAEDFDAPREVFELIKHLEPVVGSSKDCSDQVFHYPEYRNAENYIRHPRAEIPFEIVR